MQEISAENATGEFIFFCDGDDPLPKTALSDLIFHYTGSEDIIVGRVGHIYSTEDKIISYFSSS